MLALLPGFLYPQLVKCLWFEGLGMDSFPGLHTLFPRPLHLLWAEEGWEQG